MEQNEDTEGNKTITFTKFFWRVFFSMAGLIGVLFAAGYGDLRSDMEVHANQIESLKTDNIGIQRDISNMALEMKHMRELLEIDKQLTEIRSQLEKRK